MITLLDRKFSPVSPSLDCLEREWTTEYAGVGSFRLVFSLDSAARVDQARYVWDQSTGQTAAIDRIARSFTAGKGALCTVSGRMLESILDRRIIESSMSLRGSAGECVRQLVTAYALTGDLVNRREIPGLTLGSALKDRYILPVESRVGDTLLETVLPILRSRAQSLRIRREEDALILDIWAGVDRSAAQTDRPVVCLSESRLTGLAVESVNDLSRGYNYAYAVGDYTRIAAVDNGEDRRELYVNGPDGSHYSNVETYYKALIRAAAFGLNEASAPPAVLVTIPRQGRVQPNRDFFLGDLLELDFPSLGISGPLRLTALTETTAAGQTVTVCRFTADVLVEADYFL